MSTKQPSNVINKQEVSSARVWLEGDILYVELSGKMDLKSVIDAQTQCLSIIEEHSLSAVPCIIIVKGEARDSVSFSMQDLGKIVSSVDVMKYLSGQWMVGGTKSHKRVGALMNKFFFKGRLHFVDSLEEAQAEIKKAADASHTSMLE